MKTFIKRNLGNVGETVIFSKLWLCANCLLAMSLALIFTTLQVSEMASGVDAYKAILRLYSLSFGGALIVVYFAQGLVYYIIKYIFPELLEIKSIQWFGRFVFPANMMLALVWSLLMMDAAFDHNPMGEFTENLSYTIMFFLITCLSVLIPLSVFQIVLWSISKKINYKR